MSNKCIGEWKYYALRAGLPEIPDGFKGNPRNAEIYARVLDGATLRELAGTYGLSPQRIGQVVQDVAWQITFKQRRAKLLRIQDECRRAVG